MSGHFSPLFFSHLINSAKFFATRVTNVEMESMAKACMGSSISSGLDVEDLPILYSGPPEIFCQHSSAVHLPSLGFSTAYNLPSGGSFLSHSLQNSLTALLADDGGIPNFTSSFLNAVL